MTKKTASKRKSGAAVRSKDGLGGPFKTAIKEALHGALNECWGVVTNALRGDVYARFGGYDRAKLSVVDGCAGEEWWESNLSDLVTEYLSDLDGAYPDEEADWCEAIAADLENQAKRLRERGAKLRLPNGALSDLREPRKERNG